MIDFENGSVSQLQQADPNDVMPQVQPLLIQGEQVQFTHERLSRAPCRG